MDILEQLYQMVNEDNVYDNPFETHKTNETHDTFANRYIYTTRELQDGQNDMWECFVEALQAEREQAFKVGYNTAIRLIFSGGGYDKSPLYLQAVTGHFSEREGGLK